ncbi:MAG: transglycosylase SLT domain-containing protein, partial [Bacteroidia bacterium]
MLFTTLHIAFSCFTINPDSNRIADKDFCRDVVGVCSLNENNSLNYIFDKQIYQNGCDTLPQVIFWRRIMKLPKDSALITVAGTRQMVDQVHAENWKSLSDDTKNAFRDSVRSQLCLGDSARILVTEGKSFFYDFSQSPEKIHRGIDDFIENGVDPWYAQAILLIESPNKLQKSNVGAYGPFQLMKPVARMFGLKVNKQLDERADFDRSAYAASCLIKKVCLPYAREMLDTMHIAYNEQDLWFRLFVMHCYHAGAGNVRAVLQAINPERGGMELVQTMWRTQAKGFKTASQNYSQLVLAA